MLEAAGAPSPRVDPVGAPMVRTVKLVTSRLRSAILADTNRVAYKLLVFPVSHWSMFAVVVNNQLVNQEATASSTNVQTTSRKLVLVSCNQTCYPFLVLCRLGALVMSTYRWCHCGRSMGDRGTYRPSKDDVSFGSETINFGGNQFIMNHVWYITIDKIEHGGFMNMGG